MPYPLSGKSSNFAPMELAEFVARAKSSLSQILDEPGAVLYSSCGTLQHGNFYFLGLNPGGAGGETIAASLDALSDKKSNAYRDESWENKRGKFKCGAHPLQRNACRLFEALETRVEDVCASNLIFSRSRGERGAGYPEKAEICWPVHQLILEIVRPRAILTFGRQPFNFIAEKLRAGSLFEGPSGYGNWKFRIDHVPPTLVLIGLPHLSRFDVTGKDRVLEQIRAAIGR